MIYYCTETLGFTSDHQHAKLCEYRNINSLIILAYNTVYSYTSVSVIMLFFEIKYIEIVKISSNL